VRLRHLAQEHQRGLQMGQSACGTGAANDQGHIKRSGCAQDQFQITPHHGLRCGHLTRTQVKRAWVYGAHVTADKVWSALKAALKGLGRDTVTELTGGRQNTQALGAWLVAGQQFGHRAQSDTSSKGACCCAPYTSPSPGSPAHSARGMASLMAKIPGKSKRLTCAGCTPLACLIQCWQRRVRNHIDG
jgi:hypothetical protein